MNVINIEPWQTQASLINSSLDLTEVLEEVMDTIIKLTGAERGYLMLRSDLTGEMEFKVARNLDRESLEKESHMVSRTIVGRVAETGEAIITTNAQDDERFADAASIVGMKLLSILCVPLKVKGSVTGVIYTDNKITAGLFSPDTLNLLSAFADQAGVAIENARLFTQVKVTLDEISEMKHLQDNIFASISSGVITANNDGEITLLSSPAQNILDVQVEEQPDMSR